MLVSPEGLKAIGWTAIKLFNSAFDLERGLLKLPIYQLPTLYKELNEDMFLKINRQGTMTLWMRVLYGDEDNSFVCHPSLSVFLCFKIIASLWRFNTS